MGKGIKNQDFEDCLKRGKLAKFVPAKRLVHRELKTAQDDLKTAQESFKRENYKWATIQAYYAMFHAARALLHSQGYREKSHYCLIVAVKALFVAQSLFDIRLVEAFQMAKVLRENADYENEFSASSAQSLVKKAEEFLQSAQKVSHFGSLRDV